jgi:hypothetical protein
VTIARHAVKLGLQFPRVSPRPTLVVPKVATGKAILQDELEARRNRWLGALNRANSQTNARRLEPSTYAWLRRHDCRWLRDKRPSPAPTPTSNGTRVNWTAREARFMATLTPADTRIKYRRPFQRCTVQNLAREIGAEGMLKYLNRMPILKAKMILLSEDTIQFARRRIVVTYLDAPGNQSYSQVRKLAGVRSSTSNLPAVRDYVFSQCPKIY